MRIPSMRLQPRTIGPDWLFFPVGRSLFPWGGPFLPSADSLQTSVSCVIMAASPPFSRDEDLRRGRVQQRLLHPPQARFFSPRLDRKDPVEAPLRSGHQIICAI